ncbi:MAG: hypothetical protein ACOYBY_03470 [Dermatophilaceae bacterium]
MTALGLVLTLVACAGLATLMITAARRQPERARERVRVRPAYRPSDTPADLTGRSGCSDPPPPRGRRC